MKEYYFYLDSTPTHSYMKYLYKYPQRAFPYDDLVETNQRTSDATEFEYELLDTGIFDDDRYFDVFVEYAKAAPEDILIRITVTTAGPKPAPLHVLPTLWFRNTWSWGEEARKPSLRQASRVISRRWPHAELGDYCVATATAAPKLLFTENETNAPRLWGQPNATPYVKDAFHASVISSTGRAAVNPPRPARRRPRTTPSTCRRAAPESSGCACRPTAPRRCRSGSFDDACREPHRATPTNSTQRITAAVAQRGRAARPSPGAGRHALGEAVLLLRRRPAG